MSDSPAVILYDAAGVALAVQDGEAVPANTPALLIAGSDGTNARYLKTGTDGTLKVDGSATTQPVSAASLPLPTGAATETTLAAASAKLPATLGQKAMANSLAVVVASDQSAVPISAASLPLPTDAATETTLAGIKTGTDKIPASPATDRTTAAAPFSIRVSDGTAFLIGQKAMAASLPVVLASDQTSIPVSTSASTTGTTSSVASSASSVTILASNASRKGAIIVNASTKLLYIKFGTTASSSDFTYRMMPNDTIEVPFNYTGRIDGIWESANGAAKVTELT